MDRKKLLALFLLGAGLVAAATYLAYNYVRQVSIKVIEPLSFDRAEESDIYRIEIYPGDTYTGSERLLIIENKAGRSYVIEIPFEVTKEGVVENWGRYDFRVEGGESVNVNYDENNIVFVIPANGKAYIVFDYTINIPSSVDAGDYNGAYVIKLGPIIRK